MTEYRRSSVTFEWPDERLEIRVMNDGSIVFADRIQDDSIYIPLELWPEVLKCIENLLLQSRCLPESAK